MAEQKARSARARKAAAAEPTLDDEDEQIEQTAYPDGVDAASVVENAAEDEAGVGPVNPESLMRAGGYVNRDDGRGWVLEDEE